MNDSVVDVILLDVPVPLWAKSREHLEKARADLAAAEGAPARLEALLEKLREDYPVVVETADAEVRSAAVRRAESVDVAYPVPRRARADIESFHNAVIDLDTYARKAGRKDLALPADSKNFWRWYLSEILKQLDGGFPTPWPGD